MSAYRTVRLFCDGLGEPSELQPGGALCMAEFHDGEHGFVSSPAAFRKIAARAGWTHVPWPSTDRRSRALLGKDFCPDHKPAGAS